VIYLSVEDLLQIAERIAGRVEVRDHGLLASACARPRSTVFGKDAYPTLGDKCAALIHSLSCDHALVDGNKRLALGSAIAFLGMNGARLTMTNDEAYDFIIGIVVHDLDGVRPIAENLRERTAPWHLAKRRGRP
jgi:death-on-curing protein